ncbi:hypothetical protein EDD11_009266 [Mortierella claussenii]|nr:hypothetical protein EDD11_009266 [Mortierella claussenii]
MDVYSLTKKQRPTHLTRAQVDKPGAMAPSSEPHQQHSQLPPQYRQALLEQQKQAQQQQQSAAAALGAPPTLQDIENKHSQLPPQYRQAVLEQQQREHQQRMLRQQQSPPQPQQQQQQHASPRFDQQHPSASASSLNDGSQSKGGANGNGQAATTRRGSFNNNSIHQRISSAPLTNAYRPDRSRTYSPSPASGPSRAHWKPDSSTQVCTWPGCLREFGFFDRRHHCRKCGDIFCSAHCSKAIPLDQALDFNPATGVMSRACIGCFEAYEQWQGLIPSSSTTNSFTNETRGVFGVGSDNNQVAGEYSTNKNNHNGNGNSTATESSALSPNGSHIQLNGGGKKNTGQLAEGLLGQNASGTSGETLGRDDVVRLPKSASDNIAIKARPVQDTTVMPMPSVPHDWSWSTF